VWKDVIETLAALGPRLFATGIPDRFHRNYTVCGQFLATFHSTFLAQDLALNTFQQHPITEQFLVKWKTTIYHRLRFQEIARVLETTLTQQQNLHAAFDVKNTHRFSTRRAGEKEEKEVVVYAAATSSVFTMLSRCWSRQVWMPVLTPQFFKLSLQLIARYVVWLEVQVSYVSPANSEQKTGESSAELPAVKQPTLQQLTLVLAETNTVSTTLAAHLTACLATTANTTSSSSSNSSSSSSTATSGAAMVTNSVAPFLKRIEVVRGTLLSVIADQAFAESAVALQAVNRIKSTYLHSKKAIPTVVSMFVPLLLEPLNKSILQESCPLSIADKQQLVQTTVNLITTKYVQLLQELLAAVQKFQSTLQKLQQGKKKSADDGDAGSRAIQRQIELDIAAYCTQVRGLAYLEQGKLVKDLPALEALIQ
jgi:hypothetical protein